MTVGEVHVHLPPFFAHSWKHAFQFFLSLYQETCLELIEGVVTWGNCIAERMFGEDEVAKGDLSAQVANMSIPMVGVSLMIKLRWWGYGYGNRLGMSVSRQRCSCEWSSDFRMQSGLRGLLNSTYPPNPTKDCTWVERIHLFQYRICGGKTVRGSFG